MTTDDTTLHPFTRLPNDTIAAMPHMREAELRVCIAIARQTYGYHRTRDRISLQQFMALTGLSRQGVLNGIEAGVARGTITRSVSGQGFTYALVVNEVDQSTNLTSQRSRPELVNEVDHFGPKLVNEVDTQKKEFKEKERKGESGQTSAPPPKPKQKRQGLETTGASPLLETFTPSPADLAWASTSAPGVDIDRETEKFRNYYAMRGKRLKNVSAGWRNWMLKAVDFAQERNHGVSPAPRPDGRPQVTANGDGGPPEDFQKYLAKMRGRKHETSG